MTSRIIWSTARNAILLTVIYSTIINGFPIIRHNSNENSTAHEAYDIASYSSKSNNHYRIRRELDDTFRTAVIRMQKMSRVINGIALQQSITKGTVETDTLIMELLNFGTITPDYIVKIPLDTLSSVVKEVTGLSGKLKSNDEIKRMENRMLLISSIDKTTRNITTLETPGNEYLTAASNWTARNVDLSKLDDLIKASIAVANGFEKMNGNVRAADIRTYFGLMPTLAVALINTKLDEIKRNVESVELRDPTAHFVKLLSFHSAVKLFEDDSDIQNYKDTIDDSILNTIGAHMNSLTGVIENVKSNLSSFDELQTFLVTRPRIHGDRALKQTPGFPSGSADIDAISIALDDSWVQLAVDIQQIPLAKSLEQLKTVSRLINSVANSFQQRPTNGLLKIEEIRASLLAFTNNNLNFNLVVSKLDEIQGAATDRNVLPKTRSTFNTLYQNILMTAANLKSIDEVISVIMSIQEKHSNNFEELTKLNVLVPDDMMPAELDKLKNMEVFKDLMTAFKTLKPHFDRFKDTVSIDKEVQQIETDFSKTINDYITDSTKFLTMLQNLHNIPELKLVDDAIGALRKYRGVSIESFDPVATEIKNIRSKIKDFKEKIGEMKDAGNPEAKMLVQESDVSKDSENIGSATRVFSSIKSLLESDGIVVVDPTVKPIIENFLNSGQLDPTEKKNLQELLKLDGELVKLTTSLKTLSPVISMTDANLSSFSPVYNLAGNINGLQNDFYGMAGSVDKLAQGNQELLKVKKQLELLDAIGLNFAKHHKAITGTQKSLEAMDLFFASLKAKFTPNSTTQPPEPKAPMRDPTASRSDEDENEEKSADEAAMYQKTLYYVSGGVAAFLVIAAVSTFFGIKEYNKYSELPQFSKIPFDTFRIYVKDTLLQPVIHAKETRSNYNGAFNFKIYYTHGLFSKYNREHYTVDVSPSVTNMVGHHRLVVPDGRIKPEPQPLGKNDRIVVKDEKRFPVNFYHGNMLTCPNKTKIAMMQAPVVATNKLELKENVGLFFQAALEHKSELIVCLVPFGGDGCDRYIPENAGDTDEFMEGQLKITCTDVTTECDGKLVIRSLDVKFQGKKVYRTTHAQVLGWRSQNIPTSVDAQVEIMHMMEKTNKPIFMHCMDGLGQTGAMALAFMCKQGLVEDEGRLQYGENMRLIRASRVNAVTLPEHTLSAFLISYKFIRSDITDEEIADVKDLHDDVVGIEELIKMILEGVLDEYDLANWGQVIQPGDNQQVPNKTPAAATPAPPIIDPNSNPVPNADLPQVSQPPPPYPVVVPPPVIKNMDKIKKLPARYHKVGDPRKVPGNFFKPIEPEFKRLRKERDDAEKMLPPRKREEKRKRRTDLGDDPTLAAKNGKK
ncbi:hypothetical protein GCK72_011590 [Caenorhabditis remanei]|uniref:Tyrosine-protein phosphatase domain-containing protein n=1 Tax=Caenorhabditis remanei TaxID=31234 RepID=A0A6A5H939_CAERE|nr:hypothetical protein GCK72_011590 [Caenorhabditis remanei]KAF1763324.1 hypothetical protein GCK72_011590 [Caenorhabditis remanei]